MYRSDRSITNMHVIYSIGRHIFSYKNETLKNEATLRLDGKIQQSQQRGCDGGALSWAAACFMFFKR